MLRAYLILCILCCAHTLHSQSIKEFFRLCNVVYLNTKFDAKSSPYVYQYDKYSYGRTYRLPCEKLKTLYDHPVNNILFQVVEADTINAIKIYLPFDSTFHKRIETDLGPSKPGWMLTSGDVDTAGMIRDKRWFIDDYIVWFRCTRYIASLGEPGEDLIVVTLLKKIKR
jgi:hypothetical protein